MSGEPTIFYFMEGYFVSQARADDLVVALCQLGPGRWRTIAMSEKQLPAYIMPLHPTTTDSPV
jgi:hypothetical protein